MRSPSGKLRTHSGISLPGWRHNRLKLLGGNECNIYGLFDSLRYGLIGSARADPVEDDRYMQLTGGRDGEIG